MSGFRALSCSFSVICGSVYLMSGRESGPLFRGAICLLAEFDFFTCRGCLGCSTLRHVSLTFARRIGGPYELPGRKDSDEFQNHVAD